MRGAQLLLIFIIAACTPPTSTDRQEGEGDEGEGDEGEGGEGDGDEGEGEAGEGEGEDQALPRCIGEGVVGDDYCAVHGRVCDRVLDDCGDVADCGDCDGICVDGACVDCVAAVCEDDACGAIDDGCGGTVDCGGCVVADACVDHVCVDVSCADDCPVGYSCDGGVCRTATAVDIVIDIATAEVSGVVTLAGAVPGPFVSDSCVALKFVDLDRGNVATRRSCQSTSWRYSARLLAGRYAMTARGLDVRLPLNEQAVAAEMIVDADTQRDIDLDATPVFAVNLGLGVVGLPLTFIPLDGGDAVHISDDVVELRAGTYRVEVDATPRSLLRPLHQVLSEGFVVDADHRIFNVEPVRVAPLTLRVVPTLDGAPYVDDRNSDCLGVTLERTDETLTAHTEFVCDDEEAQVFENLAPGPYRLTYRPGERRPQLSRVIVEELNLEASQTLTFDLHDDTVDVEFHVTVAGTPPPHTAHCRVLQLEAIETGDRFFDESCGFGDGIIPMRLPRGRYRITSKSDDTSVAFFPQVLIEDALIDTSRVIHLDVVSAPVVVVAW